jgi:competence protein ComEC
VRITLLSVGAGQCGVVLLPSHHVVMIDAGSATVSDVSQRLVMPYLGDEGLGIIDKIILSHGDFSHISAAADLFRGYHQPQVMMSPHFQRQAFGNYPAQDLLATLMAAGCSPAIAHRGDRLDLGGGVSINVLWPPADCDMNSNNCSLVLKLNFGGRSVLFPGDIQEPAQRALLKNPSGLKCDVLVAPHQGSAESTTPEFIRAVDPRTIVASSDRKLTHKQKDFDVLATGYPLYRTSRCGAIALTIDDQGHISVQTYLGAAPQLSPSGSSAAVPTSAAEILP